MKVLNFTGRNKNGLEVLSNFYKGKIEINGNLYSCGENAFHGEKYLVISKFKEKERKMELENYGKKFGLLGEFNTLTPVAIKKKGGKDGLFLNRDELEIWGRECESIQRKICREKIKNEIVMKNLLATEENLLVHPSRVNDEKIKGLLWNGRAKKIDGKWEILGGNKLGEIWMEIRSEFKNK